MCQNFFCIEGTTGARRIDVTYFRRAQKVFFVFFFAETWHLGKFPNLKAYISEDICTTGILFSYNSPQESRPLFGRNIFPKFFSAAELLAKTIWKSMTFHPHFAKFSNLKGYSSGFIDGTGIHFEYDFLQGPKLSFSLKNFSKFFSAEELLAKMNWK